MILILSVSQDSGANGVTRWLSRWNQKFLRLNKDDITHKINDLTLTDSGFSFTARGQEINSDNLKSIWFRKGSFWSKQYSEPLCIEGCSALSASMNRIIKTEEQISKKYFHYLLFNGGIKCLGNPLLSDPNKLIVLRLAQQVGLKVSPFSVGRKLTIKQSDAPSNYITKAIHNGIYLWDFDETRRGYFSYTEELSEVLKSRDPNLPHVLSFVQEKVEKLYEVRTFFLDGEFHSVAIISQNDPQTAVDCRKYNEEMPNRNIPYSLPVSIKSKLAELFHLLELNTGSVDLIRNNKGEYVFLEVNPSGMYGPIKKHANIDVDRLIAKWLS